IVPEAVVLALERGPGGVDHERAEDQEGDERLRPPAVSTGGAAEADLRERDGRDVHRASIVQPFECRKGALKRREDAAPGGAGRTRLAPAWSRRPAALLPRRDALPSGCGRQPR